MAPEMLAEGKRQLTYDKSVDWWSLGILLYEMLFGVTPFFNSNVNRCKVNIRKPFRMVDWPAQHDNSSPKYS